MESTRAGKSSSPIRKDIEGPIQREGHDKRERERESMDDCGGGACAEVVVLVVTADWETVAHRENYEDSSRETLTLSKL